MCQRRAIIVAVSILVAVLPSLRQKLIFCWTCKKWRLDHTRFLWLPSWSWGLNCLYLFWLFLCLRIRCIIFFFVDKNTLQAVWLVKYMFYVDSNIPLSKFIWCLLPQSRSLLLLLLNTRRCLTHWINVLFLTAGGFHTALGFTYYENNDVYIRCIR